MPACRTELCGEPTRRPEAALSIVSEALFHAVTQVRDFLGKHMEAALVARAHRHRGRSELAQASSQPLPPLPVLGGGVGMKAHPPNSPPASTRTREALLRAAAHFPALPC